MNLSAEQLGNARLIYSMAIGAGLPPARALEVVSAAYAESGLHTRSTNRRSGAAGLFQLLSPGYRQSAERLGGLYNPRANTRAILPSYVSYWRSHPRASVGEAGRDVERSGQGAGFYSAGMSLARQAVGGGATVPQTGRSSPTPYAGGAYLETTPPQTILRREVSSPAPFLQELLRQTRTHQPNVNMLMETRPSVSYVRQEIPGQARLVTQESPPLTPSGKTARGRTKTQGSLIKTAHDWGLKITSGYRSIEKQSELYAGRSAPGSVAAPGKSYHNYGRAIDVAPTENGKRFLAWAFAHPSLFKEVFYDPAGRSIKNGKIVKWTVGGHSDHIHIAM